MHASVLTSKTIAPLEFHAKATNLTTSSRPNPFLRHLVRESRCCAATRMWRDLIQSASTSSDAEPEFAAPASEADIAAVESEFQIKFPDALRQLLAESNGVESFFGSLCWSTDEITSQNREFRTASDYPELYMPFDHLFFFASDSGGDCFAFRILSTGVDPHNVYRWDHETDARSWAASSFRRFVDQWCAGSMPE